MESNPDCSLCFHDALLVDETKMYYPFPGIMRGKELKILMN